MNKQKELNNDKSLEDKDDVKSSSTSSSNYEKSVKLGESIGDAITSKWNSQKKPGKVYIKNRRVHHGEVGTSMGIADAFKDSSPVITGIISGIGKGLVKDDIADKNKWFSFKKKEDDEKTDLTNEIAESTNVNNKESQDSSDVMKSSESKKSR
ncbi:hypothetical protein BH23THE1_BH23THE1_18930 [soil metagenome]